MPHFLCSFHEGFKTIWFFQLSYLLKDVYKKGEGRKNNLRKFKSCIFFVFFIKVLWDGPNNDLKETIKWTLTLWTDGMVGGILYFSCDVLYAFYSIKYICLCIYLFFSFLGRCKNFRDFFRTHKGIHFLNTEKKRQVMTNTVNKHWTILNSSKQPKKAYVFPVN